MAKSVTAYEKPIPHIGLPDWYAKQWEIQQTADTRRGDALDLRNSGRLIRAETRIRTEWDTYMNNARLSDRTTELSRWRELFEAHLEHLESEMRHLRNEKCETERELENLNLPLQVTAECISMRDCRRGTELTYDEPDIELKKELCILEGAKKLLTDRVQAAWEKLNRLEEVKFTLGLDLENKIEAINIDKGNLNLDVTCADISYKPNALRIPKNAISYEAWLDHCRHVKHLADNELSDTYNFREALQVTRQRSRNDIKAQQDLTDFALRKRIYQTEKARNEQAWQKLKTNKEMEELLKELKQLEDALNAKIAAVKCAETRLENRIHRPGYELCQDEPELGLKNEVLQLQQTKEDLLNKINCTKATFNGLEALLIRIEKNLDDKEHSLMTDVMCLDMRARLKTGDRTKLPNETDRNIELTNLKKQLPLEP
ncbi:tektin-2 [Orussus abietinus]|uniref:tektin-2 n=1 Tax=Orussus abietinus TaxID=222816 RepID=UPI000626394D|nr:tektin-2 [Orussus abietinus]